MADQPNKDVFNTDPNANKDAPKDLIAELVGDGKKYKTVEELARGRIEADVHIVRLETEAKDLREKLAKAKAIEDVLEAVKANAASAKDTPDPKDAPATGTSLTAEQVAKIVATQVTGLRTQEVKATNLAKANAEMVKLFGDKAQEVYQKEANTPELQKVYKELAETNPEKFVSLFHKPEPKNQTLDNGGKNTAALPNLNTLTGVQPGTQAYYAKLRKENPKLYMSPTVQLKMHADALSDPDKYFGRK
jgi:hypothetical protein